MRISAGGKTTVRTTGWIALAIAVSVVVLIAVNSWLDSRAFEKVSEEREISLHNARGVAELLSLLKDAETGQRGFLLTGRDSYLEPYQRATAGVAAVVNALRESIAKRPDQAARFARLDYVVSQKLAELQKTIELYRTQGAAAAIAVVNTGEGKQWMDEIRRICGEIETTASERFAQQSDEAFGAARRTLLISIVGSGLLLALLALGTVSIYEASSRQDRLIEDLQISEERNKLLVATALDAVITTDSKGAVTGWNSQAVGTFGWPGSEAVGKNLQELILPARLRESEALRLQSRSPLNNPMNNPGTRREVTAVDRDGREFPAETAIVQIQGREGVFFSVFVRDITERKQAESKQQVQLARLDLLNRITRAVGERQDLRSIFQVVIRTLEEQLPIDFGCFFLYEGPHPRLRISCVGARSQPLGLELALDEGGVIEVDTNGLSRCVRGQLVYEPDLRKVSAPLPQRLAQGKLGAVVMAPLLLESEVFGILLAARHETDSFSSGDCEFLRQLSEHVALAARHARTHESLQEAYDDLKQSQQAMLDQERLRAAAQMSSGIAHDINNALTPMALSTELVLDQEKNLSPAVRSYMELVQRASADVAHTVARLRETSRRRDPDEKLTPLNLTTLAQQVLDLTRVRWTNMPQQFGVVVQSRMELRPDLPMVLGIESEIREAAINLVFNAVDAMPHGGVLTLRTSAVAGAGSRGLVAFEVIDTGVGMDAETRRRCMEPFYTTKGERGTGLGLAMVAGIAARHEAELEIDTAPGEGSTFRLIFPEHQAAATHTAPSPVPAQTLRILAVDDDPLVLKALRAMLEADGHSVSTASGGQEGIDLFRRTDGETRYDVVITDMGMPVMDGRKVASAVKAARPDVRVVLLTGWGQRLVEDKDVPAHVDCVLNKPPKRQELRAALGG